MPDLLSSEDHQRLGASLFNHTWTLMELPARTREQDDEMLHSAHASRYHWGEASQWPQMAGGEWQCSRVYTLLGRPEPALWHARRALDLCEQHGFGDFGLAAAYEGMARATLLAGDRPAAAAWKRRGLEALTHVTDPEDAAPVRTDLESLDG
jgi:hypothetical protein